MHDACCKKTKKNISQSCVLLDIIYIYIYKRIYIYIYNLEAIATFFGVLAVFLISILPSSANFANSL